MPEGRRLSRLAITIRWAGAAGAVAALLGVGFSQSAVATAPVAPGRCSTAGLRFSYASGGATYSVSVLSLREHGASCVTARDLAGQVARDLLHGRPVPARIKGLAVSVRRPCTGCPPRYTGKGTAKNKRVSFVIVGGL